MLIELGNYKEARLWTDKALEIFHNHSALLAAKAVAFAREGDGGKAQQFSDAALAQKGHNSYPRSGRERDGVISTTSLST